MSLPHVEESAIDVSNMRILAHVRFDDGSGVLSRAPLFLSAVLDGGENGYSVAVAGDPRVRGAVAAMFARELARVCTLPPALLAGVETRQYQHGAGAKPARWGVNAPENGARPFDPPRAGKGRRGRAERIARAALHSETKALAPRVVPSETTARAELDHANAALEKERVSLSLAAGRTHTPAADTLALIKYGEGKRVSLLAELERAQNANHVAGYRASTASVLGHGAALAASDAQSRAYAALARHDKDLDALRSEAKKQAAIAPLPDTARAAELRHAVETARATLDVARRPPVERAGAVVYGRSKKASGGFSPSRREETREETAARLLRDAPDASACDRLATELDARADTVSNGTARKLRELAELARSRAATAGSVTPRREGVFPVTAPETETGAVLRAAIERAARL